MLETPSKTFKYTIRVEKSDSAYVYFQLEANEGLCFYSTLDHTPGQTFRDILMEGSLSLYPEFKHLLNTLQKECDIQIIQSTED
jgi:hypothetical protein